MQIEWKSAIFFGRQEISSEKIVHRTCLTSNSLMWRENGDAWKKFVWRLENQYENCRISGIITGAKF